MKAFFKLIFCALVLTSITSCSTIFSGTKQKVNITSEPSGARIYQDGKDLSVVTPAEVKLKRKRKTTLTFQKDGYEDGVVQPDTKVKIGGIIGNFIIGGIPGWLIDWGTGAMWKYDKNISYTFTEPEDKTAIGQSQESVSRDNPGATDLEKIIIRWYFDSEPRGARVFWRVVSSIPSIVKNTNETYLGTTPYEDTRSFNILGLTYENSQDVQIEVKLTRPGYMDQIKRFNVRQAIDQQEISSFFDMVEK